LKVKIIAEAGVNHQGRVDIAKKLIEVAAKSGADIVKFQTFKPEKLVSRHAKKAGYQIETTGSDETQLDMLQQLLLAMSSYPELISYCKEHEIQFLSTPFDFESINFLIQQDIPFWKIPSGEITNLPYLIRIAKTHKPVVLSSGMSNMDEIKAAVSVLQKNGTDRISVLHCTTEYPAPFESVNLLAIKTLQKELGLPIGYSDHTLGIEVSIAAVAMGAVIIEKHFTLDKTMEGPDHIASLEPDELARMVAAIRNIEQAMGSGVKQITDAEIGNIDVVRKSIVASNKIKKGEQFTEENITTKRPGTGLSPMLWYSILGKTAIRDFEIDELIEVSSV